jgi:hypothetical protein
MKECCSPGESGRFGRVWPSPAWQEGARFDNFVDGFMVGKLSECDLRGFVGETVLARQGREAGLEGFEYLPPSKIGRCIFSDR